MKLGGLQQALAEHKQVIKQAQASAHAQQQTREAHLIDKLRQAVQTKDSALASIKVLWNVCRTAWQPGAAGL